jgi:hypothetical protein
LTVRQLVWRKAGWSAAGGESRRGGERLEAVKLVDEALQPGDTVIWWKRIPGGDYVYPVKATILALTAKRIKIDADDDGQRVIRYVPPESLERQT